MRSLSIPVLFVAMLQCGPAAHTPASAPSSEDARWTTAQLAKSLETAGLEVRVSETIQQPFFTPPAHVLIVGGNDLEVFEYASEADAAREAQRIRPNGAIGNSMPLWVQPPRFFHGRNLIAIYLGSDARVIDVLTRTLAPVAATSR